MLVRLFIVRWKHLTILKIHSSNPIYLNSWHGVGCFQPTVFSLCLVETPDNKTIRKGKISFYFVILEIQNA